MEESFGELSLAFLCEQRQSNFDEFDGIDDIPHTQGFSLQDRELLGQSEIDEAYHIEQNKACPLNICCAQSRELVLTHFLDYEKEIDIMGNVPVNLGLDHQALVMIWMIELQEFSLHKI